MMITVKCAKCGKVSVVGDSVDLLINRYEQTYPGRAAYLRLVRDTGRDDICQDCWMREQMERSFADFCAGHQMPELTGTEKQIAYARDLLIRCIGSDVKEAVKVWDMFAALRSNPDNIRKAAERGMAVDAGIRQMVSRRPYLSQLYTAYTTGDAGRIIAELSRGSKATEWYPAESPVSAKH